MLLHKVWRTNFHHHLDSEEKVILPLSLPILPPCTHIRFCVHRTRAAASDRQKCRRHGFSIQKKRNKVPTLGIHPPSSDSSLYHLAPSPRKLPIHSRPTEWRDLCFYSSLACTLRASSKVTLEGLRFSWSQPALRHHTYKKIYTTTCFSLT